MRTTRAWKPGAAVAACAVTVAVTAAADVRAQGASETVARGKYLAEIGDCNACHTPFKIGPTGPEPDMSLALSGHPAALKMPSPPAPVGPWIWFGAATNTAFAGPWGVSYAANITPDKETGIGLWTEKMFVDAIRTGRHAGVGRPILPPMPWPAYRRMTDEDLKALFAYLKTTKPMKNAVPDAIVTAP